MATEEGPSVLRGDQAEIYRLLVDSVKDYAIFLLDPNGRILSWNEGARRIKGYTADEIVGKHFSIFYPARDVRHGKPDYGLRVAADEGRWQEEGWRVRKDGSQFWALVVLTALYNEDHELIGFAKVTRDLTERKRAEEERIQLLELEHEARMRNEAMVERLTALQSVTETALAHLDLDTLLREMLERISDVLAVDTVAVLLKDETEDILVARAARGIEEEVEHGIRIPLGKGFAGQIATLRQPVMVDDVEHADVLNPILLQKGISSLLGVPLIIEDRVVGILHVGSLHRRQFNDRDVQLLQIVADRVALAIDHAHLVESAQQARQEAEVAEATVRARDEFLSVAAHELRTPLTGLRLAAQMLLHRFERGVSSDPESLKRTLRSIDGQTERLSRLVTHLLDTVRLQAGKLELDRRDVNLTALVQSVVESKQTGTEQHPIVFQRPEELWASVDSMRLEQVVMNLIDNAIKFSPDGGQIDVSLERDAEGTINLSVRDRGLGVPLKHRARLFEQFYQAHGRDYRSGMGLGLFICKSIAEMHGGTIHAEFPDDGGTRFVVTLPVAPESQVGEPAAQTV